MRRLFLAVPVLVLVFGCGSPPSDEGKVHVTGRVFDSETMLPVEGAVVCTDKFETITDYAGRYDLAIPESDAQDIDSLFAHKVGDYAFYGFSGFGWNLSEDREMDFILYPRESTFSTARVTVNLVDAGGDPLIAANSSFFSLRMTNVYSGSSYHSDTIDAGDPFMIECSTPVFGGDILLSFAIINNTTGQKQFAHYAEQYFGDGAVLNLEMPESGDLSSVSISATAGHMIRGWLYFEDYMTEVLVFEESLSSTPATGSIYNPDSLPIRWSIDSYQSATIPNSSLFRYRSKALEDFASPVVMPSDFTLDPADANADMNTLAFDSPVLSFVAADGTDYTQLQLRSYPYFSGYLYTTNETVRLPDSLLESVLQDGSEWRISAYTHTDSRTLTPDLFMAPPKTADSKTAYEYSSRGYGPLGERIDFSFTP